jgi:myosin heavy subunit
MQYITAVSKSSTEVDRVKRQLLESNPLLEGTPTLKVL